MDPQIRAGRERVVLDALPGLTLGLAVLQSVIAIVHGTVGRAAEWPFIFVDAGSAAVALGLYSLLRKGAVPERWAHPAARQLAVAHWV